MSESWEDILMEMDSKLLKFAQEKKVCWSLQRVFFIIIVLFCHYSLGYEGKKAYIPYTYRSSFKTILHLNLSVNYQRHQPKMPPLMLCLFKLNSHYLLHAIYLLKFVVDSDRFSNIFNFLLATILWLDIFMELFDIEEHRWCTFLLHSFHSMKIYQLQCLQDNKTKTFI